MPKKKDYTDYPVFKELCHLWTIFKKLPPLVYTTLGVYRLYIQFVLLIKQALFIFVNFLKFITILELITPIKIPITNEQVTILASLFKLNCGR